MENIFLPNSTSPRGYYDIESLYGSNSMIRIYNSKGEIIFSTLEYDYNIEGYCACLRHIGYVAASELLK